MNWFAIIFRLVRLLPQINSVYSLAMPLVKKGLAIEPEVTAILERVRADLHLLDTLAGPVFDEYRRVEPKVRPSLNQILDAIDPTIRARAAAPLTATVPPPVEPAEYDVKWLQESLNKLGAKLRVDEDYGEATREAVRKFQRTHGFTGKDVDGWAGVVTSAAIHEALSKA